jgi:hypothetical protein
VAVTEQLPDLHNVYSGIEQESGSGGAERVGSVHTFNGFSPDGSSRSGKAFGTLPR